MKNRHPTSAELYALEHEARRLRAAEMARLLQIGVGAVRSVLARLVAVRNAKGLRHAA
jgi:hypothetical protein